RLGDVLGPELDRARGRSVVRVGLDRLGEALPARLGVAVVDLEGGVLEGGARGPGAVGGGDEEALVGSLRLVPALEPLVHPRPEKERLVALLLGALAPRGATSRLAGRGLPPLA